MRIKVMGDISVDSYLKYIAKLLKEREEEGLLLRTPVLFLNFSDKEGETLDNWEDIESIHLSKQDFEVKALLEQGLSNAEIAEKLSLSVKKVSYAKRRLKETGEYKVSKKARRG